MPVFINICIANNYFEQNWILYVSFWLAEIKYVCILLGGHKF